MKKILLFVISTFIILCSFTHAQELLPKGGEGAANYVSGVSVGGEVMQRQRDLIKSGTLNMADQIRTGIMSWDTILDYCAYLARFLGEVALLVGALAIIFLGYKRITKNVFGEAPKGLTMIIIGLLVVIFAYVIVKLLWYSFIS